MTHYNREASDEGYLLEKLENGLPRVVAMSFNLGLLEPVKVITENKRVGAVLGQYDVEYELIEGNGSNFEKVEGSSNFDDLKFPISVFTPESFLEEQASILSLVERHEGNIEELNKNQFAILAFFTMEEDAILGRDISISVNGSGFVDGFFGGVRGSMRQIEFYVLNPVSLKNMNVLEKRGDFRSSSGSDTFGEQRKIIYYSLPLKLMELTGVGKKGRESRSS